MTTSDPTGVLLVQVGTPDAPTTKAVRRYLAEFLGDPRVVDTNRLIWKPILHGIILRTRPRKSAALYQRVWTPEGSPLLIYSEAQAAGVGRLLGDGYVVRCGMAVGNPSIADRMDELMAAGCRKVIVVPLFPQYSSATTAAAFDCVARWAKSQRNLPGINFVRSFPDHPAYIAALAQSVRDADVTPTAEAPLLMSFHGIPKRYAETGDTYPEECQRTAAALAAALGLAEDAWRVVYQSRFGREEWLKPYAEPSVAALPGEGIRAISVATPSFVADCLETIDEIGRELRETFEEAGGEDYTRIPCVNASESFCEALATLVREAD